MANRIDNLAVEEIHQVRKKISDQFNGDIAAIAKDAAQRQSVSGRAEWNPKRLTKHSSGQLNSRR